MAEPVVPVNALLRNASISHGIVLERFKRGEVESIVRFLDRGVYRDLERRVLLRMSRIEARGFDLGPDTTRRLLRLRDQVRETVSHGYRSAYLRQRDELSLFAKVERDIAAGTIADALPVVVNLNLPSTGLLRSIVTSRPFNGRLLRNSWADLGTMTTRRVDQAIRVGMASGETTDQIIRRIRGTRAARFTDGIFGVGRREAEALTRTAITHVSNHARDALYEANSDVVKAVQWVATLDRRTCPICGSLDGQLFDLGKGERPPAHHLCRCSTVPVTRSFRELGVRGIREIKPGARAARDVLDGRVSERVTYPQWLKGQTRDVQNEVLGRRRAIEWRSGRMKIDQFVDARGRIVPLDELGLASNRLRNGNRISASR